MIPSVSCSLTFRSLIKIFGALFSNHKNAFLSEFQNLTQHKYNFDVSSGRAGLMMILEVLKDFRPEKKYVLISSLTCESVALAVTNSGLIPLFYDIDQMAFGTNLTDVAQKINEQTLAVVSSSLFGYVAQHDQLSTLCNKKDVFLIEDNAHVLGLRLKEQIVGNFGDVCFYSFGPSKSLSTISGGMVCTNDSEIAECLKQIHNRIRNYSVWNSFSILLKQVAFFIISRPMVFSLFRYIKNEFVHTPGKIVIKRMGNVQFAIGKEGLLQYKCICKTRQINSKQWSELLEEINVQMQEESAEQCYLRFPFLVNDPIERNALIHVFRKSGVWAVKSIFRPVQQEHSTNHAQYIYDRLILLPSGMKVKEQTLRKIEKNLKRYEDQKGKK